MRKTITMLLPLLILATAAAPALAADYSFSSGGESLGCFGAATSAEAPAGPDPALSNARRNKDAALLPPPYGAFSGDIPTDPSSPYHSNLPESGFAPAGQALPPVGNEGHAPGGAQPEIAQAAAPADAPAAAQAAPITEPLYYGDGSIGTLRVEKTGRTVRVYEGVGLANLKIGAGHFPATSAWDGNVALAGHNRGGSAYFSFVKDLQSGDRLTYTTKYGSRAYVVYSKTQIDEYDNLPLSWSGENTLSLITCVANVPANRYYVAAAEAPQPGQA